MIKVRATKKQQKDLADAIAQTLFDSQKDQPGDFLVEVGPEKREVTLGFSVGPNESGLLSNEFRVTCPAAEEEGEEGEEEWEEVLVVSVRYESRRKL